MVIDMSYWTRVFRNILYVVFILIGLYLSLKLAVFYMPFLIAFIISLIIEPAIKFIMKKMKLTRKASSIIIFLLVTGIILGSLTWGIMTLISEATNLMQSFNDYYDKAYIQLQNLLNRFDFNKIQISNDFIITILSLYFICTDKIYILDQIEHHMPKLWVKKISMHLKEITNTLGHYLKAQALLILISFIISLVGLYILKFINFNIPFPLLIALAIGFVDALPILGSGTVMIPWAICSSLDGDFKLGIAIIVLWIIMSVVRQFIEPRIVSKQIGIHPIFTLIAMYTGFKFLGIIGMLVRTHIVDYI